MLHKNLTTSQGMDEKYAKLASVITQYKLSSGSLLTVLESAQDIFGYLPEEVQRAISDGLDVPLAQVAESVSFYSLLSDKPLGRYVIEMCKSAPCHIGGAAETLKTLENSLGIHVGETTADGMFTLNVCGCLGVCSQAPCVMVNGRMYGPIYSDGVDAFLAQLRAEG